MKIAFIVNVFPAISETFVLNQIVGMIDLGHEVKIFAENRPVSFALHPLHKQYDLLKKTYYPSDIFPANKLKRIYKAVYLIIRCFFRNPVIVFKSFNFFLYGKNALNLRYFFYTSQFLINKINIVHCHFGPNAEKKLFLKEILGSRIKFITVFHGYDVTRYVKQNKKDVYKRLFEVGDLFMPISNLWKTRIEEIGCPREKIIVHRMGIDFKKDHCCCSANTNLNINLVTVARFVEKKGLEYAIAAVAKLMKKYNDIYYSIIGDGPLRPNLERLINDLGVQNKIRLHGWLDSEEVNKVLKTSNIYILSSVTSNNGDAEGIPVSIMEAMAMCLPVVSTIHSGIPELVCDSQSGFLVPERNIEVLSEKVEYLVTHPELCKEMGKKGKMIVEENFNINKLNKKLEKIFQELFSKE